MSCPNCGVRHAASDCRTMAPSTAVEDMRRYVDMQIVGVHPTEDGVTLELAVSGGYPTRTWVTITGFGRYGGFVGGVAVTETVDPPAPRYRNRRGYTDAPTLAQHHIDQGDDLAERDRETTDWCDL